MKNLLTNTLFISLLLSATIPFGVQAHQFSSTVSSTAGLDCIGRKVIPGVSCFPRIDCAEVPKDVRNNNKLVRYRAYGIDGIAIAMAGAFFCFLVADEFLAVKAAVQKAVAVIRGTRTEKVTCESTGSIVPDADEVISAAKEAVVAITSAASKEVAEAVEELDAETSYEANSAMASF